MKGPMRFAMISVSCTKIVFEMPMTHKSTSDCSNKYSSSTVVVSVMAKDVNASEIFAGNWNELAWATGNK